jgi:Kdo2-lipid IVA lauroyltransferase/acyltransferase
MLDRFLTHCLDGLCYFFTLLPRRFALALGKQLGSLGYYFFRKRRLLALENIRLAMGDVLTPEQQSQTIKNYFQHCGISLIEFLRLEELTTQNIDQFVIFKGFEHLDALPDHQGAFILTGHFGNWEMLTTGASLKGYQIGFVAKTPRQKFIETFLVEKRASKGVKLLLGKHLVKLILQSLKSRGFVGMVMDQSTIKREAVRAPFFNRPAWTLKSLAVLSLRTKAAVIPAYSYREGDKHVLVVEPPFQHHDPNTTDDEEIITARTAQYNQWIEKVVRAHPDQWTWTHNRWKERN